MLESLVSTSSQLLPLTAHCSVLRASMAHQGPLAPSSSLPQACHYPAAYHVAIIRIITQQLSSLGLWGPGISTLPLARLLSTRTGTNTSFAAGDWGAINPFVPVVSRMIHFTKWLTKGQGAIKGGGYWVWWMMESYEISSSVVAIMFRFISNDIR